MTHVFVVQHVHELGQDGEDMKLIGVYSSEDVARAAVQRLTAQPGFATSPNGFQVSRYELDRDHWTEGFVTL